MEDPADYGDCMIQVWEGEGCDGELVGTIERVSYLMIIVHSMC